MSPSLGHVVTDEPGMDARATNKVVCLCATADWCPRHDFACPCSDKKGRCAARCQHCLGGATVNLQEAHLGKCSRCDEVTAPLFLGEVFA